MEKEVFYRFFIVGVVGFVLAMVFFIFGERWVVVFCGWEWLGLTSLFLIAFFFSSYRISSSLKTALMNRVGDVFLFFAGVLGLLRGSSVFQLGLVFLGAMVKSAQWPFSSWLPAAMAAPTPVSALVHSSTLVTAGVWLIFRSGVSVFSMFFVGCVSSFVGGVMAIWERDLKKVVAFSTLSQLGFLFFCSSFVISEIRLVYLFSHAFFKRLLFISVGFFIFSTHNQLVGLGGDRKRKVFVFFSLSSLARIAGVHFLSGFFLKHEVFFWINELGFRFWVIFWRLCCLTVLYRFRLFLRLVKFSIFFVSFNIGFGRVFLVGLRCFLGGMFFVGGSVFSVGGVMARFLLFCAVGVFVLKEIWFFNLIYLSSVVFFWVAFSGFLRKVFFSDDGLLGSLFSLVGKMVRFESFSISALLIGVRFLWF